jgi:type II secretory pathway pseudopilin PulG
MGTQKTRGFTIIETLLFLAISGVLVIAMLAGVGVTIQIQRYRDAVETFKTLLQDQYSELASVKNEERTAEWSCGSQAETVEGGTGAKERGQSDCVILGRYVAITGADVTMYSVVGYPSGSTTTGTDIAKLRANYVLNISTMTKEETSLEWGAEIAWPRSGGGSQTPQTPRSVSFLFIRSPDSGQVYTFTDNTAFETPTPATLRDMVVAGVAIPGQSDRTLCIDSGGALANADSSVYVSAFATGPSSIETRSNAFIADPTSSSMDKTTQC